MRYNPDIHHRRSVRLREYDYRGAGAYFVTICAFQRECLFGEVVEGELVLNAVGTVTTECWQSIPVHFPRVVLDAFVIMPNHCHAILHLTGSNSTGLRVGAKQGSSASPGFDGEEGGFQGLEHQLRYQAPTGKLMQTMLAAVAEFEREMMLERQTEGIRIAKEAREAGESFQS